MTDTKILTGAGRGLSVDLVKAALQGGHGVNRMSAGALCCGTE